MRGTPPLAPPTELIGERFVGEAALALRLFRLGNPARGLFARPPSLFRRPEIPDNAPTVDAGR